MSSTRAWSDASSTNASTAFLYVSLHFWTCWPPRPSPVSSNATSQMTIERTHRCFPRCSSRTPAATPPTHSPVSLVLLIGQCERTLVLGSCKIHQFTRHSRHLISPAVYETSAREKEATCITLPIFRFAWHEIISDSPAPLNFIYFLSNRSKSFRQRFTLPLQQRMTRLCAFQLQFHGRQRPSVD